MKPQIVPIVKILEARSGDAPSGITTRDLNVISLIFTWELDESGAGDALDTPIYHLILDTDGNEAKRYHALIYASKIDPSSVVACFYTSKQYKNLGKPDAGAGSMPRANLKPILHFLLSRSKG